MRIEHPRTSLVRLLLESNGQNAAPQRTVNIHPASIHFHATFCMLHRPRGRYRQVCWSPIFVQ